MLMIRQAIARVLKGVRNGAAYGTKIRLPHALVMVFLFKKGTIREKMMTVVKLTLEHAKNLAIFVGIYKTSMESLRIILGHSRTWHALIAGGLGGSVVFSNYSPINVQINLYLLSRVLLALAGTFAEETNSSVIRCVSHNPQKRAFPVFATAIWSLVMWLFERDPDALHPSLRASMDFLYLDSNQITAVHDFLPTKEMVLSFVLYAILWGNPFERESE